MLPGLLKIGNSKFQRRVLLEFLEVLVRYASSRLMDPVDMTARILKRSKKSLSMMSSWSCVMINLDGNSCIRRRSGATTCWSLLATLSFTIGGLRSRCLNQGLHKCL